MKSDQKTRTLKSAHVKQWCSVYSILSTRTFAKSIEGIGRVEATPTQAGRAPDSVDSKEVCSHLS